MVFFLSQKDGFKSNQSGIETLVFHPSIKHDCRGLNRIRVGLKQHCHLNQKHLFLFKSNQSGIETELFF